MESKIAKSKLKRNYVMAKLFIRANFTRLTLEANMTWLTLERSHIMLFTLLEP
jgi:hypothetical protein